MFYDYDCNIVYSLLHISRIVPLNGLLFISAPPPPTFLIVNMCEPPLYKHCLCKNDDDDGDHVVLCSQWLTQK